MCPDNFSLLNIIISFNIMFIQKYFVICMINKIILLHIKTYVDTRVYIFIIILSHVSDKK